MIVSKNKFNLIKEFANMEAKVEIDRIKNIIYISDRYCPTQIEAVNCGSWCPKFNIIGKNKDDTSMNFYCGGFANSIARIELEED